MLDSDKTSLIPITDSKFHNKLDDIIGICQCSTQNFLQLYSDAIRYMYGDQIHRRRQKGWEYPVMNRVFSDLTQEIAMLSANNPRLEVQPVEDSDYNDAKVCGEIIQGYWQGSLQMQMQIMMALYDSKLSGNYVFYWYWEPMAYWQPRDHRNPTGQGSWQGDIKLQVVNPNYFGCDPDVEMSSKIATEAKYIVIERWVDMEWAANRWPVYRNYLKQVKGMSDAGDAYWVAGSRADGRLTESGSLSSTGTWTGREFKDISIKQLQSRLADLIVKNKPQAFAVPDNSGRMVKVQMVFWKDWTVEEHKAKKGPYNPEGNAEEWEFDNIYKQAGVPYFYDKNAPIAGPGGQIIGHEVFDLNRKGSQWPEIEIEPAYKRPKYPTGRVTIRLDDRCVVQDAPWMYDQWNVAVGSNYMLPHCWNGMNGVELIREMQDYVNNIGCHFLNSVKHHSDPIWLVEHETLFNKDPKSKKSLTISNAAGALVEVVKGGINRIKRQEGRDPPQSLFMLFDILKGLIQDTDGVHDVSQGKASTKDNTLGELQMLNRNTRLRIGMQGAILDHTLKNVGMGIADLMRRHLPPDRWIRRIGETQENVQATMKWSQGLADAKYDIIMVPASTLPYDEEREIAKLDKAIQILGGPVPTLLTQFLKKMGVANYQQVMKEHAIIGPLQALLEMAQQMNMPSEALLSAVQTQLQLMQSLGQEAPKEAMQLNR